jgi:hypothetical protein
LALIKFKISVGDEISYITSNNDTDYPFLKRKTILTPPPQFGWKFGAETYLTVPEIHLGQEMICYEKKQNNTAWMDMYNDIHFN